MSNARENALLLIREVRDALARGTKHYDSKGRLLTTEREILETLARDGKIQFEPVQN